MSDSGSPPELHDEIAGRIPPLVRLGPGSVVGERSPLTGKPRDATVRAVTDVVVLVLNSDAMGDMPASVIEALSSKVVL